MNQTPEELLAKAAEGQVNPLACVGITLWGSPHYTISVQFVFAADLTSEWSYRTAALDRIAAEALVEQLVAQGYVQDHISGDSSNSRTQWLSSPNSEIGGVWGNLLLLPRTKVAE